MIKIDRNLGFWLALLVMTAGLPGWAQDASSAGDTPVESLQPVPQDQPVPGEPPEQESAAQASDQPAGVPSTRKPFEPVEPSIFEPKPPVAPGPEIAPPPPEEKDALQSILDTLHGHLELGIRYTTFDLDDTRRDPTREDAYLGFLNQMDPVDDTAFRPFVNVMINKYIGIEWTTAEVSAEVTNYNNDSSDGVVSMDGNMFSIQGRLPNPYRVTPYVGLGKADMKGDFQENTWWALGYGTEESWIAAGRPSSGGTRLDRSIEVTDDDTTFFYMGLMFEITEWLTADLYYYQMDLETKAQFIETFDGEVVDSDEGAFPMSHSVLGLGVRYVF